MSTNIFIGCRLSVTSKAEMRYEGTLHNLDQVNKTITLANVRPFGTEGRRKDGPQVAASDAVHPFIVFKATEVKGLTVIKNVTAPSAAPAPYPPAAPAHSHQAAVKAAPANVANETAARAADTATAAPPGSQASLPKRSGGGVGTIGEEERATLPEFDFGASNKRFTK